MVPIVGIPLFLLVTIYVMAPAERTTATAPGRLKVSQVASDGKAQRAAGAINVAKPAGKSKSMFDLRAAVRSGPKNGPARAELGIELLRTGQRVAAERELRQAIDPNQSDNPPYELAVPFLLRTMLQRNELKELLAEFPEKPPQTQSKIAADILNARAMAFQALHQPTEARAAMDHSLALRRDVAGLASSAALAQVQGDIGLARTQTDEAIKLSPANQGAWIRSVQLARDSGDMRAALAEAAEFIQRVPGSVIARTFRIEILLELHEGAKAREDVSVLLKAAPQLGKFYNAVLTAEANDVQGAWTQLQTLSPEFIQSDSFRTMMTSNIAIASGRVNSAAAILTTFVARHPNDRLARLELAATQLNQNEPQLALDAVEPIKVVDPAIAALLAQSYLQLQRFGDAVAALEIESSLPKANNLQKRQLTLSQMQVAESDRLAHGFVDVLELDQDNVPVAGSLIGVLIGSSKWDAALSVADAIAKGAPKSPFPSLYKGQVFVARGDLVAAEAAFDSALAITPNFVPALYFRANVAAARGKAEAGKKDLQSVVAQNPASVLGNLRSAELALDNGQEQEAMSLLDRTWQRFAADPAPRLALANYQIGRGRYQEADATVTQLLRVSQNNPEGDTLQSQIQFLRGQTANATDSFRTLVNRNPSLPAAYALLAHALYASKNPSEAEEAARKAIDLAPDSSQMQKALIDIQVDSGKGDAALTGARTYRRLYPGPDADLLLADTLLRLKHSDEADALMDKMLDAKPNSRVVIRLSQIATSAGNAKKANAILSNWIAKNPKDLVVQRESAALRKGPSD